MEGIEEIDWGELELPPYLPAAFRRLAEGNRCANCDLPLNWSHVPRPSSSAWLFCSQLCQDEAKYVRYWRATAGDGRQSDQGVLEELGIKLVHVLAGGYARSARELSKETRAAVIERDGGVCRICGQAGRDIDHIKPLDGEELNGIENLQMLCYDCHLRKTLSDPVPVQLDVLTSLPKFAELERRCHSPVPERIADDELAWQHHWQAVAGQRRKRALEGGASV